MDRTGQPESGWLRFEIKGCRKATKPMTEQYEIEPAQAQQLTDNGGAILLDVREPEEFALARLEGSCLMPMQNIPAQLQKLEEMADSKTLLVLCHHGVRSLQVVAWLRQQGIEDCYSVIGGIDRWSRELDPSIPRY
jgi:rhodanese-related sulfurtransferase